MKRIALASLMFVLLAPMSAHAKSARVGYEGSVSQPVCSKPADPAATCAASGHVNQLGRVRFEVRITSPQNGQLPGAGRLEEGATISRVVPTKAGRHLNLGVDMHINDIVAEAVALGPTPASSEGQMQKPSNEAWVAITYTVHWLCKCRPDQTFDAINEFIRVSDQNAKAEIKNRPFNSMMGIDGFKMPAGGARVTMSWFAVTSIGGGAPLPGFAHLRVDASITRMRFY